MLISFTLVNLRRWGKENENKIMLQAMLLDYSRLYGDLKHYDFFSLAPDWLENLDPKITYAVAMGSAFGKKYIFHGVESEVIKQRDDLLIRQVLNLN